MEPTQRLDLCRICFQKHHLRNCKLFNGFSVRQRIYTVRAHRYCLNCLSRSHLVRDCTTTSSCRRCGEMHHTLLHTGHTDSEAVVPPQRRSVQDRLQIPSRDRRIPNRVTPPQQPRRLQHSARPVSGDRNHHQHSASEESGSLQVVSSRRRRSRRRPTLVQRQLEQQAAGQATTHQLLRQMVATINRLSESILAPVQRGRHVEARDNSSEAEEDDEFLDLDIEPLL